MERQPPVNVAHRFIACLLVCLTKPLVYLKVAAMLRCNMQRELHIIVALFGGFREMIQQQSHNCRRRVMLACKVEGRVSILTSFSDRFRGVF
eukprot:scaffold342425_cov20-Prasinocladus_malaysianus.AAC.3